MQIHSCPPRLDILLVNGNSSLPFRSSVFASQVITISTLVPGMPCRDGSAVLVSKATRDPPQRCSSPQLCLAVLGICLGKRQEATTIPYRDVTPQAGSSYLFRRDPQNLDAMDRVHALSVYLDRFACRRASHGIQAVGVHISW